jgi:hypothetical protein
LDDRGGIREVLRLFRSIYRRIRAEEAISNEFRSGLRGVENAASGHPRKLVGLWPLLGEDLVVRWASSGGRGGEP